MALTTAPSSVQRNDSVTFSHTAAPSMLWNTPWRHSERPSLLPAGHLDMCGHPVHEITMKEDPFS